MTLPDQPIPKDYIYWTAWVLAALWGFFRLERLLTTVREIRDRLK